MLHHSFHFIPQQGRLCALPASGRDDAMPFVGTSRAACGL